MKGGVWKNS